MSDASSDNPSAVGRLLLKASADGPRGWLALPVPKSIASERYVRAVQNLKAVLAAALGGPSEL
jgi:hypothetical protein